jgi:protein-disulfide isomerase
LTVTSSGPLRLLPTLALLAAIAAPATAQRDPLTARTKGSAQAPLTVYEMSDFQCPWCKRHSEQTFPALQKEYIDTGKVRWVFVNFPIPSLHPNAVPAATFAVCAGRAGRFWPAHDLLFRYQGIWGPLKNPAPYFLTLADSLKLERGAISRCAQDSTVVAEVRSDAEGSQRSGARSTPSFYVEGGLITGAVSAAVWRPILDSIYKAKAAKPK